MNRDKCKREVLRLLRRNARMTEAEIADRLGSDAQTISKLITELEDERAILGYSAVIDETILDGSEVRAIIEVEIQPERDTGFDKIAENISRFPEVHAVYLVSGGYDLRLEVAGKSLEDVAHFVASKLACHEGVRGTSTGFLLKKYKEAGIQFREEEDYERLKVVP